MSKTISFEVSVPTNEGFIGRLCNAPECGRYFKVHIISLRDEMFYPYCGTRFSNEYLTKKDQSNYFQEAAIEEARKYMFDEIDKMFGRLSRKMRTSKYVSFKYKPIRYRKKKSWPKYKELSVDSELKFSECEFPFQVFGIF